MSPCPGPETYRDWGRNKGGWLLVTKKWVISAFQTQEQTEETVLGLTPLAGSRALDVSDLESKKGAPRSPRSRATAQVQPCPALMRADPSARGSPSLPAHLSRVEGGDHI